MSLNGTVANEDADCLLASLRLLLNITHENGSMRPLSYFQIAIASNS